MDGMFQVGVSFDLVLNRTTATFEHIAVISTKCSTMLEAQNEASITALQQLQHGCLGIYIMDVSRIRCRELEQRCYEILANGNDMYHGIKSMISDWENDMHKAEGCYRRTHHTTAERFNHVLMKNHSDIRPDVADQLFDLTRTNYVKMRELISETEEVNISIERERSHIRFHFYEKGMQKVFLLSETKYLYCLHMTI
jgi:hypothetical protein